MANEISIEVTAKDTASQVIAGASQQAQGFAGSVKAVGETASGVLAANTISGLSKQVTGLMMATATAGDEILATAEKMGVSTDALQEMRFWADQNDLAAGALERAVATLNQRVGEAAGGNETYADAFRNLGVEVTDAGGNIRDTESVMRDTIAALREIEDPAARAAAAADIFGTRMARELMPALSDTSMSLDEAATRARELGIIMDGDALRASDEFDDKLSELKQTGQALLRDFLIPTIDFFATHVIPVVTNVAQLFGQLPAPLQGVAGGLVGISAAALIVAPRILAVKASLDMLGTSARTTAVRAGGIVAVLGAMVAASHALAGSIGPARTDIQGMSEDLQRLGDTGRVSGELTRIFGSDLSELRDRLDKASDSGANLADIQVKLAEALVGDQNMVRSVREDFRELDEAMASAVQSGADADEVFNSVAEAAGLNAEEIENLRRMLPEYQAATERANEATAGSAEAGGDAAAAWDDAADSLAAYTELLRTQTDPVFAWIEATENAREKQKALNEAVEEYGEDSPQARRAALDLADAQLEVFAAEGKLTGNSDELIDALRQLKDDGRLSGSAFRALRDAIRESDRAAERADGSRARFYEDHYVTTYNRTVNSATGTGRGGARAFAHGGVSGAAGGGPRGRTTLVGEQGPELVDLAPGSMVHPAGTTRTMLQQAAGPVGIVLEVVPGTTGDRLMDELVRSLTFRVRTQAGGSVQELLGAGDR